MSKIKQKLSRVMKQPWVDKLSLAALVVYVAANPLWAATTEENTIRNAIIGILAPTARLGGMAAITFGLLFGLWAHTQGEDEKFKWAKSAVIGGMGMLLVFTISNMLIKSSGVGTPLRGG